MNDFAEYRPGMKSPAGIAEVVLRAAVGTDVHALATVMSARGGTAQDHLDQSRRNIDRLPVLVIAELGDRMVGWSGAQEFEIRPGEAREWLVAGLTVVPDQRRRGIAARLLGDVLDRVAEAVPDAPVFSVINAHNLASIAVHEGLGFREVDRGPTLAGAEFTGGVGLLMQCSRLPL